VTTEADTAAGGYSIRVIARLTGIPADTLRMWERRYGFPKPGRSATKIRAYSHDDLERLNLITQALAAGHRPGAVVPLDRPELERVVALTAEPRPRPRAAQRPQGRPKPATLDGVVSALVAGDVVAAQRLIRQAVGTLGARGFLVDFAHPLAVHVGELWANGTIDVRHEHMVTDALSTQLRVLLATYEGGANSPTILLAQLPGEEHLLGTEMTALYLALGGAVPRLLGSAAPVGQIAQAALELGADAVGLSLIRATALGELDDAILELRRALPRRVELWLGGSASDAVTVTAAHVHKFSSWTDLDAQLENLRRRARS
jgi:methylmalonyl-CoA mutase cobalamin-binding subunit